MTREQKINALAKKYSNDCLCNDSVAICYCDGAAKSELIQDCILAGLRLRDEELLAMEFDYDRALDYATKHPDIRDLNVTISMVIDATQWQHEQFMKAIKGDG